MYSTSDFKRGMKVLFQGEPYEIVEFEHHKPGKGAAIVRTRFRNLITGNTITPTFRSGDKLEKPDLDERDVQFLYVSDDIYHFMDPKTFEQFAVSKKLMGDAINFLVDGLEVVLLFLTSRPISVTLPNNVVLEVVHTAPAVRGDTVGGATKEAELSTGYKCQVPLFVNEGEKVKIDTRTGDYIERA